MFLTLPSFPSFSVTDDDDLNITSVISSVLAVSSTMYMAKKFKIFIDKPLSNVWRIRWKYVYCRDCNTYFKTYDKKQFFCNNSCSYSYAWANHIKPPLRWSSALIPCKYCGKFFFQYHSSHLFCSSSCRKFENQENYYLKEKNAKF